MSERYKNLLSISSFWNPKCPVILEKGALLQDTIKGCNVLQLKFKNNVLKKIVAVNIEIIAKDAFMDSEEHLEHSYLDIDAEYGNTFGEKNAIVLNDTKYREFSFIIKKVLFADKSVYESEETLNQIDSTFKSINCLGDYADTYIREIAKTGYKKTLKYKPSQENEYWKCVCGAINEDIYTKCKGCSIEKDLILSYLDSTFLYEEQLKYDEEVRQRKQLEEEERKRQQQLEEEIQLERRKRTNKIVKKVSIIACSVAAILAVVALATRLIYCNIKYNEATEYVKSGEITEAISIFETLGTYKDSEEMVSGKAYYTYGDIVFQEKKYVEALSAFSTAGEYEDSAEKVKEIKYLQACEFLENGDYEKAQETFVGLENYKESATNVLKCKYNIAKQLMDNKEYEEAAKKFAEIADYDDAESMELECYYQQAELLFSQNKYEDAIEYYTICKERNYKYDDVVEKNKCCNYSLGKYYMSRKKYQEAVGYFVKSSTYEDSEDLLIECKYEYVVDSAHKIERITDGERKIAITYAMHLKNINYKEIDQYYKQLTKWKVEIYVNDSSTGKNDLSKIKWYSHVYWHYKVCGGETNGEIKLKYKVTFPGSGSSVETLEEYCKAGSTGRVEIYYTSGGTTGTAKITFYNAETNEVLGSDSVILY